MYVIYPIYELPRRTKSRGKRQKAKEDMTGLRHWSKLHRLAWKCVASGGEAYFFFFFVFWFSFRSYQRKKKRRACKTTKRYSSMVILLVYNHEFYIPYTSIHK